MTNIIKSTFWLTLSKLIIVPVAIGSLSLLGRILGPDGMGQWALIIASGSFMSIIFINWLQPYYVRYGCEEYHLSMHIDETWNSRWPMLLLSIIICGIVTFTDPGGIFHSFFGVQKANLIWTFLYFIYIVILLEAQAIHQIVDRLNSLAKLQFLVAISVLILYLCFYSYVRLKVVQIEVQSVLAGFLMVNVLIWIVAAIGKAKQLKIQLRVGRLSSILKMLSYSWPLFLGFIVGYFSDWGDQVLIKLFYDNRQVGIYQAAYSFFIPLLGLCSPLSMSTMPSLVVASSEGKEQIINYMETTVPGFSLFWIIFILILTPFLPSVFVLVLGDSFREAANIIMILAVALPGAVISNMCANLYFIQGRTVRNTVIMAGMTAINVGFSLLLLPEIGIIGAAIATTISYVSCQSYFLMDQSRYLGADSSRTWLIYAIALGIVVLQTWVGGDWVFNGFSSLIAVCIILTAAYYWDIVNRERLIELKGIIWK